MIGMYECDRRRREKVDRGCQRGSRAFRKIRGRHELLIFLFRAALDDQERQACPSCQAFDRGSNEEISELVLAGNARDDEIEREFGSDIENRSEEHTSEIQSLMRTSYAVLCLKKKQISHSQTGSHILYTTKQNIKKED